MIRRLFRSLIKHPFIFAVFILASCTRTTLDLYEGSSFMEQPPPILEFVEIPDTEEEILSAYEDVVQYPVDDVIEVVEPDNIMVKPPVEPCRIPDIVNRSDFRTATLGIAFDVPDWTFTKSGVINIGVLYLDFPEYRWNNAKSTFELSRFFREGIDAYYSTMSNNNIEFNWVVSEKVLSLTNSVYSYDIYGRDDGSIRVLDTVVPNTRRFFINEEIDAVLFVINPSVPVELRNAVWVSKAEHNNWFFHTAIIGMGSERRDTTEIIIHDIGHMFGLPDLYVDVCRGHNGCHDGTVNWLLQFQHAGAWSTMSYGTHDNNELLGWERWLLQWLDDDDIFCITDEGEYNVSIIPSFTQEEETKLIIINIDTHKNIVIEMKTQTDYCRRCDDGLLVYTVNSLLEEGPIRVVRPQHSTDIVFEDALLLYRDGYNSLRYDNWVIEIITQQDEGFLVKVEYIQ